MPSQSQFFSLGASEPMSFREVGGRTCNTENDCGCRVSVRQCRLPRRTWRIVLCFRRFRASTDSTDRFKQLRNFVPKAMDEHGIKGRLVLSVFSSFACPICPLCECVNMSQARWCCLRARIARARSRVVASLPLPRSLSHCRRRQRK